MSHLHNDLLDKEQELQKAKEDLASPEACYQKETHLLIKEHQDKKEHLQKKIDHLKHQLEKSELLN